MDVSQIISMAFVMGLIGSFHCLGMCGPIAMALPMGNRSNSSRLAGGTIYNLGRIMTYAVLGLVLGLAGDFLISPQIQSSVSIVFGVAIGLYLLLPSKVKTVLRIAPSQSDPAAIRSTCSTSPATTSSAWIATLRAKPQAQ